jgi:uncharacterized membrane protein
MNRSTNALIKVAISIVIPKRPSAILGRLIVYLRSHPEIEIAYQTVQAESAFMRRRRDFQSKWSCREYP